MILRKPKKVAASKTLSAARAYPYIFMEDSRKSKWWIVATAAVLALLTLYYYTGSWVIVVLFLAANRRVGGFSDNTRPEAFIERLSSLRGTAESEHSAMWRLRERKLDDQG